MPRPGYKQTPAHRQAMAAGRWDKMRLPQTNWLYGVLVPSELYARVYKQVMTVHRKSGVEIARNVIRAELLKAGHYFIYVRKSSVAR